MGGRLMGGSDGGKGMAAPHWQDPIVHQGWRKGDKDAEPHRGRLRRHPLRRASRDSAKGLGSVGGW